MGFDAIRDCLIGGSLSPYGRVRMRCFSEPSFPDGTLKSDDFSLSLMAAGGR